MGGAGASGGQGRELCFRRPHISAGTIPDIYIVPVDVSYDKVCGVLVRCGVWGAGEVRCGGASVHAIVIIWSLVIILSRYLKEDCDASSW